MSAPTDTGIFNKRKLDEIREKEISDMKSDIVALKARWGSFWRSLAAGAIGVVLLAGGGGIWISDAVGQTAEASVVAKAAKEKSEKNEKRIKVVEDAVVDHAYHIKTVLGGIEAIAKKLDVRLPKEEPRVHGAD